MYVYTYILIYMYIYILNHRTPSKEGNREKGNESSLRSIPQKEKNEYLLVSKIHENKSRNDDGKLDRTKDFLEKKGEDDEMVIIYEYIHINVCILYVHM
jgi:hypothetical protein